MKSLSELMNLEKRVALITGGAGHIGFAAAETLAELGARIVLLDSDKVKCEEKAKIIHQRYGIETLSLGIDLVNEEEVRLAPQHVLDKFGCLDILINCAALVGTSQLPGWTVPFEEQSSSTWRKALEVNLTAVFVLSQASREALKCSGHGSIINFSSIYGVAGPDMKLYEGMGMGSAAAYAVSKGGLIQLTRWLASVLAPDIRVNAITPGGVFRGHKEPFLSRYTSRTLLKRMATEQDLKGALAYLASDLSAYVTGHNLIVDGGWTTI